MQSHDLAMVLNQLVTIIMYAIATMGYCDFIYRGTSILQAQEVQQDKLKIGSSILLHYSG